LKPEELKAVINRHINPDRIKERLVRAVQRPAYQTDLFEKEPMVLSYIREFIRPELESAGVKDIRIDDLGNLIARVGKPGSGGSLVFLAYGMTPAPGSMKEPFSGKIVDGSAWGMPGECLWGRGSCEQKGSTISMIEAIEIILWAGAEPPGEIIFVTSTAGETGRHDSVDYIVRHGGLKADWGILAGAPKITIGNKGRVDITVTIQGKASHSSRPWEGVNAIEGAMLILERLKKIMPHPSAKSHPELGRVTLTPIRIESFPKATHTVQDRCEINLDRRLLPGDDPDEAVEQVQETLGDASPFKVTVKKGIFMYPSEISKDAPVVKGLSEAIRTMLTREPEFFYSHSTIDAGYLNRAGVQTVLYGAQVPEFAHTDHDMVPLSRVVDATRAYAYLALTGVTK
jgi:acetylornithine deacetylase